MTALAILLALIVLLLIGVPIAFALGGLGLVLLLANDVSPIMVPQGLYSAVDNFILRLRRYLEPNPRFPKHLHTVRGAGYKLLLE